MFFTNYLNILKNKFINMKNILILLILSFYTSVTFAQTPTYFKYQGVARDADNQAYSNTTLGIKISIVKDTGNGAGSGLVEYSEKHQIFTSPVGVFSLNIGNGHRLFGDIEEINWGSNSYWLKIEMDVNGGEDYVFMGSAQILPVPIAVHAMTVADKNDADADPQNELQTLQFNENNNTLSLTNGGTVDLSSLEGGAASDDQTLQLNGTILSIEGGNQVSLAILQDGVQDADADPQNELQTLQFNPITNSLSISNGNIVNLPLDVDDNDHSPTNELQTLNLNGNNLSLSNGGGQVDLSEIEIENSLWSQAAGNILFTQKKVAIGFAESLGASLEISEDVTIRKSNGNTTMDLFSNSTGGHFQLFQGNEPGVGNSLLVNIDGSTTGSTINLRNTNGHIRGEWQVNNSDTHFNLLTPNENRGISLFARNTNSIVSLAKPNGADGVSIGASAFGGSAIFFGSTDENVAFIGRNNSSPEEGKISIGNPSNSELIRLSVGSSDGAGVKSGHLVGFSTQGRATFGLSTRNSDHKDGLLSIYNDGDPVAYVSGIEGGAIFLQKNNNNKNVYIGTTSGTDYRGRITLYDSADNGQAGIYVDSQNKGVIWADIKNFRLDHPFDDEKEIWYACIEGPEAAAYERGTTQLVNGEATVLFPDHFGLVANHETMTVMLTPLSADCKGLAVIEKTRTGFKVKELFQGTGTYSFDWEVKCVRKGYENYNVIRDKKDR